MNIIYNNKLCLHMYAIFCRKGQNMLSTFFSRLKTFKENFEENLLNNSLLFYGLYTNAIR